MNVLVRNVLLLLSNSFERGCTAGRVDADNIDTAHLVKPKVVSVPDGDQRRSRNGAYCAGTFPFTNNERQYHT